MGNSLRSDNPIAKLNAYPLIFTFSKPCSEVTSATHTPAQKGVRKGAPLFSRIFAGREESSRHMQDFKRRFGVIRWKFLKAGSAALMEQWMPEA